MAIGQLAIGWSAQATADGTQQKFRLSAVGNPAAIAATVRHTVDRCASVHGISVRYRGWNVNIRLELAATTPWSTESQKKSLIIS